MLNYFVFFLFCLKSRLGFEGVGISEPVDKYTFCLRDLVSKGHFGNMSNRILLVGLSVYLLFYLFALCLLFYLKIEYSK